MQFLTTQVTETYQQKIKAKSQALNRILFGVNALILLAAIITLYLAITTDLSYVTPIVLGGVFATLIMASIIISYYYVNEKPLYEFLYPKLIDDLQFDGAYTLKYEAYPKIKEQLKASKLFTKFAMSSTRAGFYFIDDASHQVELYDTYYYTTTNNSVEIHFNGYYVIISGIQAEPIQIRTKGKPHHKEIKYTKTTNEKQLKIYQSHLDTPTNEYVKNVFDLFLKRLDPSHLFVSVVDKTLYVAIDYHKPLRKIKTLDKSSYQALKKQLTTIIDTINASSELKP